MDWLHPKRRREYLHRQYGLYHWRQKAITGTYIAAILAYKSTLARKSEEERITKHLTGLAIITATEETEMELNDFPAVHSEKTLKLLIRNMVLEVKDSTNFNGKGKANGKNTNKSTVLKHSKEGCCSASLKKKQRQRGAGTSSNDTKPASESAKKNQRNRSNHGKNGGRGNNNSNTSTRGCNQEPSQGGRMNLARRNSKSNNQNANQNARQNGRANPERGHR